MDYNPLDKVQTHTMWWGRVIYRVWKSLHQKPHWLIAKGAYSPQWSSLEGTTIIERKHPSPVPGHPCKTQNVDHLTRKHQTLPDSVPFVAFSSIKGRKAEDRPRKGSTGRKTGRCNNQTQCGFLGWSRRLSGVWPEQPVRSAWTAALWLCKETCLCVGSTKGRCEGRTLKHVGMSPENCVPSYVSLWLFKKCNFKNLLQLNLEVMVKLTFIPFTFISSPFNMEKCVQRKHQNFINCSYSCLLLERTHPEITQQNGILVTPSDLMYFMKVHILSGKHEQWSAQAVNERTDTWHKK